MTSYLEKFFIAVRAGTPVIILQSVENLYRLQMDIARHYFWGDGPQDAANPARGCDHKLVSWSLATGIQNLKNDGVAVPINKAPAEFLGWFCEARRDGEGKEQTVVLVHDLDGLLAKSPPMVSHIQAIGGEFGRLKELGSVMVFLTDDENKIPASIAAEAVLINTPLADRNTRRLIIESVINDINQADDEDGGEHQVELPEGENMERLVSDSAGLLSFSVEQAAYMSIIENGRVTPEYMGDEVERSLKRTGCMELSNAGVTFSDVAGFQDAKDYLATLCGRRQPDPKLRFKGGLFLGVPGAGKSLMGRALAGELGLRCIIFNIASILNSLVGSSEARMRAALAMIDANERCVVIIDEIEKMFGQGGERDGGVMTRLLGQFLNWLNDRTSEAILFATCNDMTPLPPEFSRAERWDIVYYVDVPTEEQRDRLVEMYSTMYDVPKPRSNKFADGWTGAEVKACFKQAACGLGWKKAVGRIVPVTDRMGDKLLDLRDFASKGSVDVETGMPYTKLKKTKTAGGRQTAR